ncbi:MAG: heme lyase CcmF/NrfE family subunit [Deltaproteobacteria bacterium]|nr:heme lyase CcmF/NrfE family subunit [Deltaproteobacteria bacterium]
MIAIGNLALYLALATSLYAVAASLHGALARRREFVASGEHAAYATWGLICISSIVMLHALLTNDFSIKYVAAYTSTTLPARFRVTALWGGMEGSLLFWALILTTFTSLALFQNRHRNRELMPYVTATAATVAAFFVSLLVFMTPPFALLSFPPAEGTDLNPLLQNYWMQIHPPALYLGYVSWTIPFGFAIGALATGRLDDLWIRTSRRWCLMAWFFLGLGNLLGARWAYEVLGWGGYWAWDPVENAAFMPWLTGTAYLHSVMIQERKDMLKVWNMTLIILTFALTIFGTFLTRSGVISSVHSFTQSGLGPYFLTFLAFALIVSFGLMALRLRELRPRHQLDSLLSRESAFLFNNLLLVGIAFATLWGTIFPVLSEWVRGVKITVGPPFFNRVNAPLAVALLLLMGVGPVIAWRRATFRNLVDNFLGPAALGLAAGGVGFACGMRSLSAILVVSFSAFVLYTVAAEFHSGARARVAMVGDSYGAALLGLIRKNQRRYGGYVIHVGVVFMFLGVTMSSVYRVEELHTVKKGERFTIGRYTLEYQDSANEEDPHMAQLIATLAVYEDGEQITTLRPEKRFYKRPEQPATEVDMRSTMRDDLYVVLGSLDNQGVATFQTYVNPLVWWLWFGGVVLVLGTGIAAFPSRTATLRERARETSAIQRQRA